MTPQKVWSVLEQYDRELAKINIETRQFEKTEYDTRSPAWAALRKLNGVHGADAAVLGRITDTRMLAHCRWMAQHCLKVFKAEYRAALAESTATLDLVARGKMDPVSLETAVTATFEPLGKAMRWLAYIQGVCNALGVYSCTELRDHSRADTHSAFLYPAGNVKVEPVADKVVISVSLPDYPCCEAAVRIEGIPGNAETLLGGNCEVHGRTVYRPVSVFGPPPYKPPTEALKGWPKPAAIDFNATLVPPEEMSADTRMRLRMEGIDPDCPPVNEPGVIAMGGPPPAHMINPDPPTPAQMEAAALILKRVADATDPTKVALATPDDKRTPAQVELLKCSVYGCCNRHADQQACDCMEKAEARSVENARRAVVERMASGQMSVAPPQQPKNPTTPERPRWEYGASSDSDNDAE